VLFKVFKEKSVRNTITGDREAKFLLWAYIILPAFFFTISGINVRDHYLIVLFPMIQVLFTIVVNEINPKFISWILVCQFWVSSNFLMFVHNNPNIKGDYGVPFSEQAKVGNPIPKTIDE
jgi:4-amino-4-deoxy-L-arabinose transferase-like glycosyltransferase